MTSNGSCEACSLAVAFTGLTALVAGCNVSLRRHDQRIHIQLMREKMKVQPLEFQRRLFTQHLQGTGQPLLIQTERRGFAAHDQSALRCPGQLQIQPQHHRCPHTALPGDARQAAQFGEFERREIDFGGCRCQAMALTGNARAVDPVCRRSPFRPEVDRLIAEETSTPAPDFVYRRLDPASR